MNSSGLTVIMDAAPTIGLLRIVSQHQIPTTMTTLVSRKPLLSSMFDDDTFDLLPTRFMDSPSWNMPSMFNTPFFRNGMNLPAVNIKDNAKSYDVEFAVPGYKKDELRIHVENGVLTVSSEKKMESEEEKNGYTRREFNFRSFQRSFSLPEHADADNVKANYTDGILKLSVPKKSAPVEKAAKEVKIA